MSTALIRRTKDRLGRFQCYQDEISDVTGERIWRHVPCAFQWKTYGMDGRLYCFAHDINGRTRRVSCGQLRRYREYWPTTSIYEVYSPTVSVLVLPTKIAGHDAVLIQSELQSTAFDEYSDASDSSSSGGLSSPMRKVKIYDYNEPSTDQEVYTESSEVDVPLGPYYSAKRGGGMKRFKRPYGRQGFTSATQTVLEQGVKWKILQPIRLLRVEGGVSKRYSEVAALLGIPRAAIKRESDLHLMCPNNKLNVDGYIKVRKGSNDWTVVICNTSMNKLENLGKVGPIIPV